LPETPIAALRKEIEEQLGQSFFPDEFVFLKHVGRCLALVNRYYNVLSSANFIFSQVFSVDQQCDPDIWLHCFCSDAFQQW